jgi:hypothetical protein
MLPSQPYHDRSMVLTKANFDRFFQVRQGFPFGNP